MKKLFLLLFSFSIISGSYALDPVIDDIEEYIVQTSSKNAAATSFRCAISAPSDRKTRNCLTHFSFSSTAAGAFALLDGSISAGTTIYSQPTVAANTIYQYTASDLNDAICGSPGNVLTFNVTVGTATVNFRGYIKR